MEQVKTYIDFLRFCLDITEEPPRIEDWEGLYRFMDDQALLGIGFHGIDRMSKEWKERLNIPSDLMLDWYGDCMQVRELSRERNRHCVELTEHLQQDGFVCCILKGQGNAMMYPQPELRMSGDIDVWVSLKSQTAGSNKDEIKAIIAYARRDNPEARAIYYHIDYEWKESPVEIHYLPGMMNNPVHNRRLQHWFSERKVQQMANLRELPEGIGRIPVPTPTFNVVFQLTHVMRHFFLEGIGIRQLTDYYFLLRSDGTIQEEDWEKTLKYLGLWKFAGAVMYVMQKVFLLDIRYMIAPVDERRGRVLLREVLAGGNFGTLLGIKDHGMLKKHLLKTQRILRFVWDYPSEALCEPLFRVYHLLWRWRYN